MKVPYKLVMIFDGDGQTFPKFPKCQVCNVFTISPKTSRDKVDFLQADKHRSFLQVYLRSERSKIFKNILDIQIYE